MALEPVEGAELARLAAAAVAARLRDHQLPAAVPGSQALADAGASFVTLEARGQLRGCVGTVEAARPLYLDVIRNAQRAMRDPRLRPVTPVDWPDLDVKVAVLSPSEPLAAGTRAELVAALRPGVDGLLITDGARRATFLPSVWQRLDDPERFLAALLAKGGWAPGEWPAELRAWRYTTAEYRDLAPRPALAQVGADAGG
jgi:AmmeMemoRadiSam system protein A